MTTNQARPGSAARAERRILVQLSVVAVSMATLAVAWLGITAAEHDSVTAVIDDSGVVMASQPAEGQTTLVPAPQTSGAAPAIRRSRAS